VRVRIESVQARLRAPFASAHAQVTERELVLLELGSPDGFTGSGEAAPLQSYDAVRIDDVRAALEDCRATLESDDGHDREALLAQCLRLAVLPQAVAAIDLALWDLAGHRAREPVWRLLGAATPAPTTLNYTIFAADRAGAAREAAAAREAGFHCVKVKVGIGDDAGRIASVRAAAGPELAIRLDANGAWSVAEAEATLAALAPAGIELCEEPVHGIAEIEELSTRTRVPLALDESASLPGSFDRRVCDAVCLKIARCGGISGLLEAAARARAAGYRVYLASTLDGPLGIAAALHAACAVGPDLACGLATLAMFDEREDPLPTREGRLAPPTGPGLGARLTEWYGAR
jgi:L-alanine-DL-glutamate epimerase-like enolase superfamily enzyme